MVEIEVANENNKIYRACKTGNLPLIKKFHQYDFTNHHNRPLRLVARFGKLKVFKYLCEEIGLDPNCENNRCIGLAAEGGHLDIVKYCLEHGADPAADDNYAIRFACGKNHLETVRYLYQTGKCDITAKDYNAFKIVKFWANFTAGYGYMLKFLISLPECPSTYRERILDDEYLATYITGYGCGEARQNSYNSLKYGRLLEQELKERQQQQEKILIKLFPQLLVDKINLDYTL